MIELVLEAAIDKYDNDLSPKRILSFDYPHVPAIEDTMSIRTIVGTGSERKCRTVDVKITDIKHILVSESGKSDRYLVKVSGVKTRDVEN